MSPADLQALYRHLTSAAAIVERAIAQSASPPATGGRNQEHFRENGHLSDAGIAAIYELFDRGHSIEQAAQEMGISIRGAAGRRSAWLKRKQ